jgi:ketosteroid isomerase-like protein
MSQENVELVRGIYEEPGGITGGTSERLARDVRFDFTSAYPDRRILRGIAEVREFRETGPWHGAPIHFKPERFFDVDDERVLVFVHVSVVGAESGIPVETEAAHEFTIRDGLVVYFKVYADRKEALEAAGLFEIAWTRSEGVASSPPIRAACARTPAPRTAAEQKRARAELEPRSPIGPRCLSHVQV